LRGPFEGTWSAERREAVRRTDLTAKDLVVRRLADAFDQRQIGARWHEIPVRRGEFGPDRVRR